MTAEGRCGANSTDPHALVVGGSGMLAGTCTALAQRGWRVSVVARDRVKLNRLAARRPAITPISVDYGDSGRFRLAIEHAIERRGPIELAVCWIRSSEPEALQIVSEFVTGSGRLLHVLGSTSMGDAVQVEPIRRGLGARYTRVTLGGVRRGPSWRWLTHDEINSGVVEALVRDDSDHVVGVLGVP